MRAITFFIAFSICAVLIIGCRSEKAKEVSGVRELKLIQSKETFGSLAYLSRVEGMIALGDQLFLPDYENSRVVQLDTSLNPVKQIGRKGSGPGELDLAGFSYVAHDRLFVTSPGSQQIVVYDTVGTFIDRIPIPGKPVLTRFAVLDDILFLSTPRSEKPLTMLDMDGLAFGEFGQQVPTRNPTEKRTRNYHHLALAELKERTVLVAVNLSEPMIGIYDPSGQTILFKNIENTPFLGRSLEEIRIKKASNPDSYKSTYILFVDIQVQGEILTAFLYSDQPPNRFLRFRLSPTAIEFIDCLEIRADVFIQTFATIDKSLYLFDANQSEISIYQ